MAKLRLRQQELEAMQAELDAEVRQAHAALDYGQDLSAQAVDAVQVAHGIAEMLGALPRAEGTGNMDAALHALQQQVQALLVTLVPDANREVIPDKEGEHSQETTTMDAEPVFCGGYSDHGEYPDEWLVEKRQRC